MKGMIYAIYEDHYYETINNKRVDIGKFYIDEIQFADLKDLLLKTADFSEAYILTRVFEDKEIAQRKTDILTEEKLSYNK
jgi:hypothetical protein